MTGQVTRLKGFSKDVRCITGRPWKQKMADIIGYSLGRMSKHGALRSNPKISLKMPKRISSTGVVMRVAESRGPGAFRAPCVGV